MQFNATVRISSTKINGRRDQKWERHDNNFIAIKTITSAVKQNMIQTL